MDITEVYDGNVSLYGGAKIDVWMNDDVFTDVRDGVYVDVSLFIYRGMTDGQTIVVGLCPFMGMDTNSTTSLYDIWS